jgi:hypothetical protein
VAAAFLDYFRAWVWITEESAEPKAQELRIAVIPKAER